MSTIEKAAARLAAGRQGSSGKSAPPVVERAREARARALNGSAEAPSASPRVQMNGAAGPVVSPTRFCDIDIEEVRERGFLLPDSGRTQLAQEMRRIKRPLLLNIQKAQAIGASTGAGDPLLGNPTNLIMITSALPGEGKTFTAINLAMSIAAEMDRRVLLVDADVARADVCRQLGIPPGRGLSDLLRGGGHLFEDAVLTSNIERLSILPAGSHTEHVDELFASDLMGVVVQSLAEADPQRVVIFDASPLLATTEAAVLAQHMGQTVLVVEAGKTPQDAVAHAIAQLEGCDNVSLILNKTSSRDSSYGYGYGYGYGSAADGSSEREIRQVADG